MTLGGRVYSLLVHRSALNHEFPDETDQEEAGENFRVITHEPSATAPLSTIYKSGKNVEFVDELSMKDAKQADIFVPLGYLIEPHEEGERITNYVWALNISTKPKSLWLIYDYVTIDKGWEDCQASLYEIYWNFPNMCRNHPYTYEVDNSSEGFLELGERWDIVQVLDDVDQWHPDKPLEQHRDKFRMRERLGESLRAELQKTKSKS
ncbi:MAG: hypothetical protein Q9179_001480 [Wetmoreana sp. 5 TL-2023]